jgi:acetyl-CoA synthetase
MSRSFSLRFKGLFFTGDYAVVDQDEYIWVAGGTDEVLKVAGHRMGTYELESALVGHRAVAEVPLAFVALKNGFNPG